MNDATKAQTIRMPRLSTRRQPWGRWASLFCIVLSTFGTASCAQHSAESPAEQQWQELRHDGKKSNKADDVAGWLMAELLRPGGTAKGAKSARARLDDIKAEGVLASLARGIDDSAHGKSNEAADHFFAALQSAQEWEHEETQLYAWYAALRALELSSWSPQFTNKHREQIAKLLENPGNIGFRAYSIVVDYWAENAFSDAEENIDKKLSEKLGCTSQISLAGPFGTNDNTDILRHFDAEKPGVWPARFEGEQGQYREPRVLKVDAAGCDVIADEAVATGIFYAQTFVELEEEQTLLLAVRGSSQMWINDTLVLERDVRKWGSWPRIATQVRLPAGRHRVVAKVRTPETTLRILKPNGQPAKVKTSNNQSAGYSLLPPQIDPDPNELMRFIGKNGVIEPKSELTRFIAAYLSDDDGESDVAAVLFEPFVKDPEAATGIALSTAAIYVNGDPIYDESQTRDLVHELQLRAAEKDPELWYPAFQNIVWQAEQQGATTVVESLEALSKKFKEVPTIPFTLTQLYDELDWGPEHEEGINTLLKRFPNDEDAIKLAIEHFESEGDRKKVDELLQRLVQVNPDTELLVTRALTRKNYQAALDELKRLQARRPGRKDVEERMQRILVRSGDRERTFQQLKDAIERQPQDAHARLALADAELAEGKKDPLTSALIESISAGADPSPIEGAIDLIEGITALEPYRLDGMKVIKEYEAKANHLSGTAARVLDYGAVWVNPDGSSRFLEHEIVRIQSEEAISRFTEERTYGLTLHMRVIKKDGSILEPEQVSGKPTVTMPHLEIGDYIETERIVSQWGDGIGEVYSGPGWYFREKDVAYARSEFVIISPAEKELILETHNGVPEPEVERSGSLIIHRYRVDESPAAPVEPMSPPAQEFLPRVSVGWGISLENRLRSMSRSMISLAARDPRIIQIAQNITKGKNSEEQKLRAIYHWVLDSVQDGEEQDGRRVVVARNGNRFRGFETLCRALNIPVDWVVAESSLASPISGPIASAERSLAPLLRVGSKKKSFLTIDDKFAPFGTVPSYLRGQDAYVLGKLEPEKIQIPVSGSDDGISYQGQGSLDDAGNLKLDFKIIFLGTYAASLRNGLSQIPENQLGNVIESRLLAQELPGARLVDYKVIDKDQLDKPLIISINTEVPHFATQTNVGLLISPPFMPQLSQLTTLARRATPLLIGQETMQSLDLKITLPPGSTAQVAPTHEQNPHSEFEVTDKLEGNLLHLQRQVVTRAGRVSVESYPDFQKYTTQADASLSAAIRVSK